MPKHGKKAGGKERERQPMPAAQTFFRFTIANTEAMETVRKLALKQGPQLMLRDGPAVQRIRQAPTPEALIDLAATATGLADIAWNDRMRALGPAGLAAINERLPRLKALDDAELADALAEKLIGALRWQGAAAAEVLLRCFDDLSDYGKSLAALVLGLLGARESADRLWRFYQETLRTPGETHFIGALWALADFGDPRVGGALAALLDEGRDFYELYGLLARAGAGEAVAPLIMAFTRLPKGRQNDALMALVAVGHRIGREAMIAEIERGIQMEERDLTPAQLADGILTRPADWPEEYFQLFYRGFDAQAAEGLLA